MTSYQNLHFGMRALQIKKINFVIFFSSAILIFNFLGVTKKNMTAMLNIFHVPFAVKKKCIVGLSAWTINDTYKFPGGNAHEIYSILYQLLKSYLKCQHALIFLSNHLFYFHI